MCMCLLSTGGSLDVSVTKEKHTLGNSRQQRCIIFFAFLYDNNRRPYHLSHDEVQSPVLNFTP